MVWLSADCDTPTFAAARVKLRSRATNANAFKSPIDSRAIHEAFSYWKDDYTPFFLKISTEHFTHA
jgi:hypothetical protein